MREEQSSSGDLESTYQYALTHAAADLTGKYTVKGIKELVPHPWHDWLIS